MNYANLKKEVQKFDGKKLYLLGKDADGVRYYAQEAEWSCDWYWSFGWIEGFSGKTLSNKSFDSHQHADNFLSEWFTEWNGSKPKLVETTFTEKEGWTLSELFKSFYVLRDAAELLEKGSAHITENPAKLAIVSSEMPKRINEVMIPAVIAEVIKILS